MLIGMLILAYAVPIQNGQLQSASLLTFYLFIADHAHCTSVNGARAQLSNFQGALSILRSCCELITNLLTRWERPVFQIAAAIEFVDVDFGYDASALVLAEHFTNHQTGRDDGTRGASGAGKSTLADLIPFYDRRRQIL